MCTHSGYIFQIKTHFHKSGNFLLFWIQHKGVNCKCSAGSSSPFLWFIISPTQIKNLGPSNYNKWKMRSKGRWGFLFSFANCATQRINEYFISPGLLCFPELAFRQNSRGGLAINYISQQNELKVTRMVCSAGWWQLEIWPWFDRAKGFEYWTSSRRLPLAAFQWTSAWRHWGEAPKIGPGT